MKPVIIKKIWNNKYFKFVYAVSIIKMVAIFLRASNTRNGCQDWTQPFGAMIPEKLKKETSAIIKTNMIMLLNLIIFFSCL